MTTMEAPSRADTPAAPARRVPWWRPRTALVVALVLSLGIHFALSLVPDELPSAPDEIPLTATLQELPPPPVASAPPVPKAKPKPRPRPAPAAPVVPAAPEPLPATPAPEAPETPAEAPAAVAEEAPAAEPIATAPEPPVLAEDVAPVPTEAVERKTLPPRVDLAYKVFYGTQGFLIGQATYRFEHADNRYRIGIVGDARGLAALLFRGQGRVESRGVITPEGLQPHELVVDKFNKRGSERAEFDWENGIANLHDNKTAPLELPTFDLLALMWQFYFQPPEGDVQTFALATTKRIYKVTATRKGVETIEWANGPVETELWHRTSEDGRTEGYVWLAPSLRWLPVKVRAETPRGTVEVLLDSIRVDDAVRVSEAAAR
jgi:hypothetical protein